MMPLQVPFSHERSGLWVQTGAPAWNLLQPLAGCVAPSKLPDSSLCLALLISQAYAHDCPMSVYGKNHQNTVISLQLK